MNQSFNNLNLSLEKIKNSLFFYALFSCAWVVFILLSISSPLLAQEQEKEERWFEIEVILFKLKSEDGLYAESWKDDSKLIISEDAIDFLQPYEILDVIQEQSELKLQVGVDDVSSIDNQESVITDNTSTQELSENINDVNLDAEIDVLSEQAFLRLSADLLQLTGESKSIEKQSRYQLVEHFSWRQPVDSRANATKIRIAGGFDYSNEFEYSGEKKIEFIPVVEEVSEDFIANQNTDEGGAIEFEQPPIDEEFKGEGSSDKLTDDMPQDDSELLESIVLPEAKPLNWVPEIDGEIKVYIHRKYLHVDTNLVYRKPDEITVDIFHLDEQPLTYSFAETQPIKQQSSLQSGLLDSPQESNTLTTPSTNFDWEFDSDFLNKKSDKLFTKKLFNYPLIQERRIRSGELHYYDHPLIGMLIMIRPYETEVFEDELINTETQETSD